MRKGVFLLKFLPTRYIYFTKGLDLYKVEIFFVKDKEGKGLTISLLKIGKFI